MQSLTKKDYIDMFVEPHGDDFDWAEKRMDITGIHKLNSLSTVDDYTAYTRDKADGIWLFNHVGRHLDFHKDLEETNKYARIMDEIFETIMQREYMDFEEQLQIWAEVESDRLFTLEELEEDCKKNIDY